MNNAALAAIHEFGKTIKHPGGTPYEIVGDGKAVFVEKGEEHDGVTDPHMIEIPQRSFLRSTASENREMWLSTFIEAVANELPQNNISDAAERVGAMMMGHVKKKLTDLKSPPNSPSTIRQKGSSNPLIDTGQLRRAIDYEVNI
jgi:phage gpG-like protein